MILVSAYFVLCFSLVYSADEWTYDDQAHWPATCNGSRQSPIDINFNAVMAYYDNPRLLVNIQSYATPQRNVVLRNTGHTAELSLNSPNQMPMFIGWNSYPYVFQNMHFHWGDSNLKGSEHSINSRFYSAEIHFVHYNKIYGNFSTAVTKRDGIVVNAVLCKLSQEDNKDLELIITALSQVINPQTNTNIPEFTFASLMPRDIQTYYQYDGSLTTPPCAQTVTFNIFEQPISISANQLSQFRRLLETNGTDHRILSNRRDLQKLNGRIIDKSMSWTYYHYVYPKTYV